MFEISAGTVAGRGHRDRGVNNQDAFYFTQDDHCAIALVCDGCGSESHSEVGAKLGARLLAETINKHVHQSAQASDSSTECQNRSHFWEAIRQDVLASLRVLINPMNSSHPRGFSDTVYGYFLFTIVGALITETRSSFFSIGDGVIIVNGSEIRLGPFPSNQPPFLGYGLTETSLKTTDPEQLQFKIHRQLPTDELESFLLGTDGVEELMQAAKLLLPGKDEPIGLISQFWEEDRFFTNPDMINRRLRLINRDSYHVDWGNQQLLTEHGRLHDDTTFIVGRRAKARDNDAQ